MTYRTTHDITTVVVILAVLMSADYVLVEAESYCARKSRISAHITKKNTFFSLLKLLHILPSVHLT